MKDTTSVMKKDQIYNVEVKNHKIQLNNKH